MGPRWASPITSDPDIAVRLEEAGVGAIVLPSLFVEEILAEEVDLHRSLEQGTEQFAEALGYFRRLDGISDAGDRYVLRLERIKPRASVPVIASLNAATPGGWVRHAKRMEQAGADALELNLYHLAVDPDRTAAGMEATYLELIAAVRAVITIPLAVKHSPYYSAIANFAPRVREQGANGLVLFNRFYQPDLDTLGVVHRVGLSRSSELRLPLRWIAILRPQLGPEISLAATSGIHNGLDALKAPMVGVDVAMMTSALLVNGPEHVRTVEQELWAWMAEHEYESVTQLRGSASQAAVDDGAAFERANYQRTLHSWSTPGHLLPAARR